ncbi:hypothetical protein [Pleurocapsa sp. FMAR1]|uniref:hypothetical protein n=1 Tax=Pleurocapsa sp. FMAR1 TaxID=3040204 RepID=UPI0029C84A3D|nr:hypothetical protein [Pleurocapsa sp. FMAR1]
MTIANKTRFFNKYSAIYSSLAIALSFLLTGFYSVQANAQSNPRQYTKDSSTPVADPISSDDSDYLKGIEAGDSPWGFSSASESKSLDNNLNQLGQFDISTEQDQRNINTQRTWDKFGSGEEYSVSIPIYKF